MVGTEGAAVVAGTLLATFTDTGGADAVIDYTATIDWGDGTTTAATVSLLGNGGNFAVTVSTPHSYAEEGIFAINVTVTDGDPTNPNGIPTSAMTTSTATIDDADLSPALPQPAIPLVTQGIATGLTPIVSFNDANPAAPLSDFTATIDWGDGSAQSAGVVSQPGGPGTAFLVSGNHLYAQPSTGADYAVNVHVVDEGGETLNLPATVPVSASTITGTAATFNAVEGQAVANVVVATFTDSGLPGAQ